MGSYGGKKEKKLTRKESKLQRLIQNGASVERLIEAAIEVRESRIRVLQSKQSNNPKSYEQREVVLGLEDAVNALQNTPVEVVIAEFRCGNA
jgi:hypothetical protein